MTDNKLNNEESTETRWTWLSATEKESYVKFHKKAFEEDLKHSEKNILEFPRWSVISGYYCMHDLTKLFLAEKFNVKLSGQDVHAKTIEALEYFIKDAELKRKLLKLLEEAKDMYYSAERLKERTLPTLLKRGKQERSKAQYYSGDYSEITQTNSKKASYFLETIVEPYVKLMNGLMNHAP